MKLTTRFIWLLLLSVVIGVGGTVVTGNAATWHKGVPTFLRTKYRTKIKGYGFYWTKGTKHTFFVKPTQSGAIPVLIHAKYKKVKSVYTIRGINELYAAYKNSSGYSKKNKYLTYRVKRVGSKHIKIWKINGYNKKWTKLVQFKHFPKWATKAYR